MPLGAALPLVCFLTATAAGCAPVMPPLAGGDVMRSGTVGLAAGGATRVPLGDLRRAADAPPLEDAAPGGVSPLLVTRVGLGHGLDVGLGATPGLVQGELRRAFKLGPGWRLIGAARPFAGWIDAREQDAAPLGWRMGFAMPWAIARSVGSLYELWAGARLAAEYLRQGAHAGSGAGAGRLAYDGHVLRGGGFVGMAVGFKHIHGLVELAADYEAWSIEVDTGEEISDRTVTGVSLTPAFAIRLTF